MKWRGIRMVTAALVAIVLHTAAPKASVTPVSSVVMTTGGLSGDVAFDDKHNVFLQILDTRFFAYYGTATYVGDVNWKIGAVGYFDHDDNHADVIWQHLRYGWVAVWAMDGNAMLDTHNLNARSSVTDMNLRIVAPK
jgi:hypothetical protein